MRISFGKHHTDLNWLPVLIFLGLVMFGENLLDTMIWGPTDPNAPMQEGYSKQIAGVAIMLTFIRYKRLSPWLKSLFWIIHAALFLLVLESLYKYGKPMIYPHVFSKVFLLYFMFTCYIFFKDATQSAIRTCIFLLAGVFFFDLFVHYPTVLSMASFIDVERGFSSYSTHFITLPLFFFLNRYLAERKMILLLFFFVFCGMVLFLNHRSVWMATGFGMALNMLYIFYKGKEPVPLPAVTPIVVIPILFSTMVLSFVLADNPELMESIQTRVEDISKADEQGTGKWRLQQFQSYMPFILDRPLIGNRFEGYELPNQFIHEEGGTAMFDDATGHHFHSFYVDALFYGGIALLVILMAPCFYLMWRAAKSPYKLKLETMCYVAFCASGIIYGTSYLLLYYFYGVVGMGIAVLENDEARQAEEEWQLAQNTETDDDDNPTPEPLVRHGRPEVLPV